MTFGAESRDANHYATESGLVLELVLGLGWELGNGVRAIGLN